VNFIIYLDDATVRKPVAVAKKSGETKNALIRKALGEWLARHSATQSPDEVLSCGEGSPMAP